MFLSNELKYRGKKNLNMIENTKTNFAYLKN